MRNKNIFLIISVLILGLTVSSWAARAGIQTPEDKILSSGFQAYMDGNNKVALDYFEEVLRINPKNTSARKALEKTKIRLKKAKDEKKKKHKRLADAKVKEGKSLRRTGDVVAAIDAFHVALSEVPNLKSATRQIESIRRKMKKTLENKKFNLSTWAFARGTLAYLDKDWAKAYRIWSERLNFEPNNVALMNATRRAEQNFVTMMMAEKEEFLRRGAREFYRQGLYQESKTSWQRVLEHKADDKEALEGMARAENAILKLKGESRDRRINDLLEEGLQQYAGQDWTRARNTFKQLVSIDPNFKAAKEYLVKINQKLAAEQYIPTKATKGAGWRENRPSNQTTVPVHVPGELQNIEEKRRELQSQLKRDPTNIRVQQELDKLKKMQQHESERIYKDGLIAYSQGNRSLAIDKWKQVLVLDPDHKKAAAALRKARAEEERSTDTGIQ